MNEIGKKNLELQTENDHLVKTLAEKVEFIDEIQIKIPSEIKPGENYMRVIRLVGGCHQLSWLSDSIRAQNERGISDIRAVGTRG